MSEEVPENQFWSALTDATVEQLQQLSDAELLREAQSLGWDIEAWAAQIRASVAAGLGIDVDAATEHPVPPSAFRLTSPVNVSLPGDDGRAVLPGGTSRDWRSELASVWPSWDESIEAARQRGESELPALSAAVPSMGRNEAASCIRESSKWASMDHGLGEYARFALLAYLDISGEDSPAFNPLTVARLPSYPKWFDYLSEGCHGELPVAVLDEFDRQVARGIESIDGKKRREQLEKFFSGKGRWGMFAAAVNAYARDHSHPHTLAPLKGEELRRRRFSGRFAVTDFIAYVNTGVVPARQAPFPDELADLGISMAGGFVRDVVFLPSAERVDLLRRIVRRLVQPRADAGSHTVLPITCLWSRLQPNGLVAMCQQMLAYHADLCTRQECRRLPIIYIPVGLAAKTEYVSRHGVVRDLHRKLLVRRAQIRGEAAPRALVENASAEEVNAAIGEIRAELAREPALLVFGIHQVPPVDLGALQEEILDAPLPYIIHRLMPETGDLEHLNDPENAHATQLLILADGPLSTLAGLPVASYELPECPPEQLGPLVQWTGVSRVQALMPAQARDIVSNEVELSLVETALALQERSPGSRIGSQAIDLVWGEDAVPAGELRVRKLTAAVLDHLIAEAAHDKAVAWQLTLLHIVALMPGGVRLFTMARVMAGYVRAIAACGGHPRPAWCRSEAELWRARTGALSGSPDDAVEQREHGALERTIQGHVVALKENVRGLLRGFHSASKAGFDDYPHPYECQEVPPFRFNFRGRQDREQLEFVAPVVRDALFNELRERFPEKHSLLNRLLAEEFIRRAAIVNTHRADVDHSSLIDKRYLILGVHHGLQSLQFGLRQLLSAYGRVRCTWLIPHHTRLPTYHWIYQWLYVEMLNGHDQELSKHHGAERVKRQLLEELLACDPRGRMHEHPERYRERSAIRHFEVRSQILHGLAHVAVRRSATPDAQKALEKLHELTEQVRDTVQDPASRIPSTLLPVWQGCIEKVNGRTGKLMLDLTVSRAASSLRAGADGDWLNIRAVVHGAFETLEGSGARGDRSRVIRAVARAIWECHHCVSPDRWQVSLLRAAREIRKAVPERVMQPFYSLLVRFGELIVYTAEPKANDDARMRRRRSALIILEVAETLRSRYASVDGHVLTISARPARSAARMCLMLAWRDNSQWFQRRAGHYCFNVMGNRKQQGIDRISLLILRAMTIRLRGKPEELPLAMTVLKTAERALINFPDRVELWIRFYLERAKIFASRASQEGISKQEARWCSCYCRCDVEAIIRLARDQEGDREGWVIRANRILNRIPSPAPWDEASVIPATAMRHPAAAAGARGGKHLALIKR